MELERSKDQCVAAKSAECAIGLPRHSCTDAPMYSRSGGVHLGFYVQFAAVSGFSGTPAENSCVAPAALKLWLVLLPWTPSSAHISFTIL